MHSSFSPRLLFLNIGHFIDHMLMLIFAKAAFSAGLAFGLAEDGAYAEMIPYGIPSLVLFGACAPIAAHLADRWHRNGMIGVFFVGIGLSAVLAGFTNNPLQMAFGLAAIGVFAAIYHPVGIAMVIEGEGNVGWRLGLNGVWGNMGVAGAPLVTGFILAEYDWLNFWPDREVGANAPYLSQFEELRDAVFAVRKSAQFSTKRYKNEHLTLNRSRDTAETSL